MRVGEVQRKVGQDVGLHKQIQTLVVLKDRVI